MNNRLLWQTVVLAGSGLLLGCGPQPGVTNSSVVVTNANAVNTNTANSAATNSNSAVGAAVETKEPEAYQATVTMRFETVGAQATALPPISAKVARGGGDRRMEFAMPAGGRVIFLDKGGKNYLILPEKRQFAELDRQSLGFDVRRMLMPEQIVAQVKFVRGVERVGEEKYNGRDVIKYRYAATANTQTRAGEVATESYLMVDKETGLPLRSETTSQSTGGGNVQGVSGLKVVTEMTDLRSDAPATLFDEPKGLEKIQSDQVRAQVDIIFSSIAAFLGQVVKSVQSLATPTP